VILCDFIYSLYFIPFNLLNDYVFLPFVNIPVSLLGSHSAYAFDITAR
jgi:hypothetical protein